MQTQEEKVIERLREFGEVDNFWAISNFILRLGAIICQLKKKGYDIEGMFGRERGYDRPLWKNYYYIVRKREQRKLI
jgi:hypothetical protein